MKVKDVIELLQKQNPEDDVVGQLRNGGPRDFLAIHGAINVFHQPYWSYLGKGIEGEHPVVVIEFDWSTY